MTPNSGTVKIAFYKNFKLHITLALISAIWSPIILVLAGWPLIAFGALITSLCFLCISIIKQLQKNGYEIVWLK